MSVALPEIRVGDPLRYESLSVFPLFSVPTGDVDYCYLMLHWPMSPC